MTSSEIESLALKCFEILESQGEAAAERFCQDHAEHSTLIRGALDELRKLHLLGDDATEEPELDRVFGDFRLERLLGRGGMGVVYLAEQQTLGRRVALKLMRPGVLGDERGRARFAREVEALSKLNHPGICTVYEAGEIEGQPYLAMQYIAGETLAKAIEDDRHSGHSEMKSSSRALRSRVELVEKVARALHCAHVAGFVHRDVKPANILLDDNGEPVLVDFGLVRDESDDTGLTASAEPLGTVPYMSPEQVRGLRADRRADVYALGVTLFESITGVHPFEGQSRDELFHSIVNVDIPNPRRSNRLIDKWLRAVLEKAVHKEPARRFQSVEELADELARWRNHEPLATRPSGPVRRSIQWMRRNPTATGVLAATAVGLSVSLVFLMRSLRNERRLSAHAFLGLASQSRIAEDATRLATEALHMADLPAAVAEVQRYLYAQRRYVSLNRAQGRYTHVQFSPDGDHFVVCGPDVITKLYRADGSPRLGDLCQSSNQIQPLSFAPDRSKLALAADRRVHVYALTSDPVRELRQLSFDARVQSIAYSPDSKSMLVAVGPHAWHVNLLTDKRTQLEGGAWQGCAWWDKDRFFAAGHLWENGERRRLYYWPRSQLREPVHAAVAGETILAWDRSRIAVYRSLGADPWRKKLDVREVVLHPKGESVLATCKDGSIRVFDAQVGRLLAMWRVEADALPLGARWDPSGSRIFVSTNLGGIFVCNVQGQIIDRLRGHAGDVIGFAASKDGNVLVSAGSNGEARRWELRTLEGVPGLHRIGRSGMAVSPDGTRVAVASTSGDLLYCDEESKVLARARLAKGHQHHVSFCADGKRLLIAGAHGVCLRWDPTTDAGPALIPTPPGVRARGCYRACYEVHGSGSVIFHRADGRRIIVGDKSGRGRFLLPQGMRVQDVAAAVNCVAVSKRTEFALGAWDKAIRVIDLEGRVLWQQKGLDDVPNNVRFCDRGDSIVAAVGRYAHVWHRASGRVESFGPHDSNVVDTVVVTSDSGERVLTGTMLGRISVFERGSRRLTMSIKAHRRAVQTLGVTSSGRIVSSSADGHVRWWSLDRESVLRLLERVGIKRLTDAERAAYEKLLGPR